MAMEARKITVEILNTTQAEPDGEKKKEKSASEEKFDGDLSILLHPIKSVEKVMFGKHILMKQAYDQVKGVIGNAINSSLNRYYALSENYMLETDITNIKTGISKATSFGTTVVSGAMVGGPWGAAIAAAGWVANEAISYNNNLSSYYTQINTNNYNTQFSRTRASLVDNGRGTEN